jgi:hypothetical protein
LRGNVEGKRGGGGVGGDEDDGLWAGVRCLLVSGFLGFG